MKAFILNLICLVLVLVTVVLTPLRYFIIIILAILDSKLCKHTKVYKVSVDIHSAVTDWADELIRSIR